MTTKYDIIVENPPYSNTCNNIIEPNTKYDIIVGNPPYSNTCDNIRKL